MFEVSISVHFIFHHSVQENYSVSSKDGLIPRITLRFFKLITCLFLFLGFLPPPGYKQPAILLQKGKSRGNWRQDFHLFCQAEREELSDHMILLILSISGNHLDIHMRTYDSSLPHFFLDITVCHLSSR